MKHNLFLPLLLAATAVLSAQSQSIQVKMDKGEQWWGAANYFGRQMPFTQKTRLSIDLRNDNYHNQCASLLLSDQGRVIWADAQALFTLKNGEITVEADSEIVVAKGGDSLPEAYRYAMRKWFPASGKMPDPLFFIAAAVLTATVTY